MIPAQTVLVAVAACIVIVAVWAWGIVREDAANQAGFDAGRLAGAAEERQRARRSIVAGTRTGDPSQPMPRFGDVIDYEDRADGAGVLIRGSGPEAGGKREIPDWHANDGRSA